MDCGPERGIRFRFDAGLLRAVQLDAQRKPPLSTVEEFGGAPVRVTTVVRPRPTVPDADADAVPEPDELRTFPPIRTTQDLAGAGRRTLRVSHVRSPDGRRLVASLRICFELTTAITWSLAVAEADDVRDDDTFTVIAPHGVTIGLSSVHPHSGTVEAGGARLLVLLPAGRSELTITVTSEPVFVFGDTLVVCRPDQVREAAVVVSCLPGRSFTPVISIDPAPLRESEYVARHRSMKEQLDRMETTYGGSLAQRRLLEDIAAGLDPDRKVQGSIQSLLRASDELGPYRSWLRHNQQVSALIRDIGFERIVFLYEPRPAEIRSSDPALVARAEAEAWGDAAAATGLEAQAPDDHGSTMFTGMPNAVYLLSRTGSPTSDGGEENRYHYGDLAELTELAWTYLSGSASPPPSTVDVPAAAGPHYLTGLYAALRSGVPLRPSPTAQPSAELVGTAGPDPITDEAVLVENTGDAANVLAVSYAHHRGAKLVVTPPPDLTDVNQAIGDRQRKVVAAARTEPEDDDARGLFGTLWQQLTDRGRRDPFADIENAVTRQVPSEALDEVGDRRLTVFTTGLPYPFVRTDHHDWSGKTIGHVAADPTLIVLSELHGEGVPPPPASFSLVFDPGFFRESETDDVVAAMKAHAVHPILLSGKESSALSLLNLTQLPVEFVFFNTHGSDDSIVLGNTTIRRAQLAQQPILSSRPVIFNNSCQSWTGVGQEFVRLGARGYIGTLWSIPSRLAAQFARVVMRRMTAEQSTVGAAIVDTGLRPAIARSYLYVGTANARLAASASPNRPQEAALAGCLEVLRAAAGMGDDVAALVHREVIDLRGAVEGGGYDETIEYVDVLLNELFHIDHHHAAVRPDPAFVEPVLARLTELLEELPLPRSAAQRRWAWRYDLSASLYERQDRRMEAIRDFRRSLEFDDSSHGHRHLRLAQLEMESGFYDDAARSIESADNAFAAAGSHTQLITTTALRGRLALRRGNPEEAARLAEEAYTRGELICTRRELASFLLDACIAHRARDDYGSAAAAASAALDLSRAIPDDLAVLSATCELGLCQAGLGDVGAAFATLSTALTEAQRLGATTTEANVRLAIGQLVEASGLDELALNQYWGAADQLAEDAAWEALGAALSLMVPPATRLGDVETLWNVVNKATALCCLESYTGSGDALVRSAAEAAWNAALLGSRSATADGLAEAATTVQLLTEQGGGAALPANASTLLQILVLIRDWTAGADPAALLDRARALDRMCGTGSSFADRVSRPHTEPR